MQQNKSLIRSNYINPITFFIILCILVGCQPQVSTELINRDISYFLIEPESFPGDFQKGDLSAFIPNGEIRPDVSFILDEPITPWSANDFRMVANAIHKVVWGESIESWDLQVISLSWDCEYFEYGPENAYYSFFRSKETEDNTTLFVSKITIEPRRKTIHVAQEEFFPVAITPKSIPIGQLEDSLLDALSIAEEKGGSQIRENEINNCDISVTFNTNLVRSEAWIVDYVNKEGHPIEFYYIDPTSGELKE